MNHGVSIAPVLVLSLLAPVMGAAAASAAAQEPVWSATAEVAVETFDSQLPAWSDWVRWGAGLERRFDGGALLVEGFRSRRFGEWDAGAVGEAYVELGSRTYLHARGQVVPDALALPTSDVRLELFQGVGDGWEVSASGRRMAVRSEDIWVYGASTAKYLGSWYLRGRADVSSSTGGEALYVTGAARRYLTGVEGLVELSAGTGREVADVAAGPVVDLRDGSSVALRLEAFPRHALGLGAGVSWATLDGVPDRIGGRLGLIYRW